MEVEGELKVRAASLWMAATTPRLALDNASPASSACRGACQ